MVTAPHLLTLREFPITPLQYEPTPSLGVANYVTVQLSGKSVYINVSELRRVGISPDLWKKLESEPEKLSSMISTAFKIVDYLLRASHVVAFHTIPQSCKGFRDISLTSCLIVESLYANKTHLPETNEQSEIFIKYQGKVATLFVNLESIPPLGEGAQGVVRKIVCLYDERVNGPRIVAMKEFKNSFEGEYTALKNFSEKRGIIPVITGGNFESKNVIFFPFYECNLLEFCQQNRRLTLDNLLSLITDWLTGMNDICEKGIHTDIRPENLYLKSDDKGIKGVIGDFGSYRDYGVKKEILAGSLAYPPKFNENPLSSKFDVWGMGMSLLFLISHGGTIQAKSQNPDTYKTWLHNLAPGWASAYGLRDNIPRFLSKLVIHDMLNPTLKERPTPKEVLQRFTEGLATFKKK